MTCDPDCKECEAEAGFWKDMQVIHDNALAEVRAISAAAARNCRRRMRRGGRGRCYRCHFGAPCNAGLEHVYRSRMNPNRTTWGKGR